MRFPRMLIAIVVMLVSMFILAPMALAAAGDPGGVPAVFAYGSMISLVLHNIFGTVIRKSTLPNVLGMWVNWGVSILTNAGLLAVMPAHAAAGSAILAAGTAILANPVVGGLIQQIFSSWVYHEGKLTWKSLASFMGGHPMPGQPGA